MLHSLVAYAAFAALAANALVTPQANAEHMQLSERAPKTTFERAESFLSSLARRFEPEKEVKGGAVRRPYGLYVRQSGDSPSESEKAGSGKSPPINQRTGWFGRLQKKRTER